MIDLEKLRKKIRRILDDPDYYGGPILRIPPLASRDAIADAIISEVGDMQEDGNE